MSPRQRHPTTPVRYADIPRTYNRLLALHPLCPIHNAVELEHATEVIDMTETLLNRAMVLAETHGLRGYDAVQLAAACEVNTFCAVYGLPPRTFVCADSELNIAAAREALLVDNPNAHP